LSNTRTNYLYSVIYRLSICILPLIVTPFISRTLGAQGNGLYAFSSTVACYFIMFSKLGLESYGNRSIAFCLNDEERKRKTFWSIYSIQVTTSLISCALYIVLVELAFPENILIYRLQFLYVLSALFDVSWFFFGIERFRLTTVRSLLTRLLIIIGTFLFVRTSEDVPAYTLVMSACFLLEQLILFPFVFRHARPIRVSWAEIRPHLLPNLKLFVPLLALSVYNWMDKLMLGIVSGKDEVAYYAYAESINNLPKGIVLALGTVMLPQMSRLAVEKKLSAFRQTLKGAMTFICFVCCMMCFGIAGVSQVFVPLFLGEGYEPSIALTVYLAFVMIPMSLTDVLQSAYLVPMELDRIYIRSVALGAFVNLALNALFIPPLAALGAVLGTIGAALAVFFYQMSRIRGIYTLKEAWGSLWPFLICGAAEFAATYSLGRLGMGPLPLLLIQLAAGGGVYLGMTFVLSRTCRKDLRSLFVFFQPGSAQGGTPS
jgi:O-antigen/teichoic acid export membrane protein